VQQLPNQPNVSINQVASFANGQQIRISQQTHNGGLPASAQSPRQAAIVPQQSRQTPQSHPQTPVISPASINSNGTQFISPTRQRPVQIQVPQTQQPMTSP